MPDMVQIFGSEITVGVQPRRNQVSYSGFAGAHGMTGLMHGSRGYVVTVRGTLRTPKGLSFQQARVNIIQRMENLESWLYVADQAWTYLGETYLYMRVEDVQMLPGPHGKIIQYTQEGEGTARFIAFLRSLL